MHRNLCLFALLTCFCPAFAAGNEWPHPRGPRFDSTISETGALDADPIGLELAWRAPLGPGYSAISVAGGLAVTGFGDADASWVAAFDTATGREVWRSRLGDRYLGRDGSTDGPLSSPVINEGRVYALDPRGDMLALRLEDGTVLWRKGLKKELGAREPGHGFATTPLPAGEVVVVQIGGEGGQAIVGLDALTGEIRWSLGDDKIEYQSPAVMTLARRTQVVAVGVREIVGIDAVDGERLWTHRLDGEDETFSTSPTFIGDDRFVVSIHGVLTAYRLSRAGRKRYRLDELFRSRAFGSTYAAPVYHEGYIYGFRRHILTCADATNGERVWRSRAPGGDGLILVDGRLVIFAAGGNVVIADASPEGYRERARLQALDGGSMTWPSFAEGKVFVRNLEEIAAVGIGRLQTRQVAAEGESAAADHQMARWVARIEAADDPSVVIDELLAEHPRWPIVDGEYLHFLYQGDVEDVALAGSMIDAGAPRPMKRIAGTDLFVRTFQLELGCRWEYRFLVDYETWFPDPRNPLLVPIAGDEGMASEVTTGDYAAAEHLADPGDSAGRIENLEFDSKIFGEKRRLAVWLPPGYDTSPSDAAYPLLLVNSGTAWLKDGLLANTLANLVGERIPPLVVAFVAPGQAWWLEAGGGQTENYVRMLAEELVPALSVLGSHESDSGSPLSRPFRQGGSSEPRSGARRPRGAAAADRVPSRRRHASCLCRLEPLRLQDRRPWHRSRRGSDLTARPATERRLRGLGKRSLGQLWLERVAQPK
jgi:outer membrane protein assembly factor BamB